MARALSGESFVYMDDKTASEEMKQNSRQNLLRHRGFCECSEISSER